MASSVRIGLISDIHYDGCAVALNRLREAMAALNERGVRSLVLMGDLVNGNNKQQATRLLHEVASLGMLFRGTLYFMPGNHDLDHLSKAEFYRELGREGAPSRFQFEVGGYAFICMDGNFLPDGTAYDSGNFTWKDAAVPEEQLDWLRAQLAASPLPVIMLSHQRIDLETRFSVRNAHQVRDLVAQSNKVKAICQGHDHEADRQQIGATACYTLNAWVGGAGPAVLELSPDGVQLDQD